MKLNKKILICGALTIFIVIAIAGCIETSDKKDDIEQAGFITAQQLSEDINISVTDEKLTIDFKSFEKNDTVTIHDTLKDIVYLEEDNLTQVKFQVEGFWLINHTTKNLTFYFKGDITDKYDAGDKVNITFHIKWKHWAAGPQKDMFEYSVETANESELDPFGTMIYMHFMEYTSANFPGYVLPLTCISYV